MDVVLEVADTVAGDYIYSKLLPARNLASLAGSHHLFKNATLAKTMSSWSYKPATSWFQLEPTKYAYLSAWSRDNILRQAISLFLITWIFGLVLYFVFATLSYYFVFDKETMKHPKFLKNQIVMEIKQTNMSMPLMSLCTMPFFLAEVRGYGKFYDTTAEGPGRWYDIIQFPFFIFFTDFLIYWIHRGLHHSAVYKHLHKPHHKWIMPTPFASHAFHPLDGFAQSVPYHIFPFIFPLQKIAYVMLFIFVNFWTIMIHDGVYVTENPVINGAACHTYHHLYFNYNYGQYTTIWDRVGGSYRKPSSDLYKADKKMSKSTWDNQVKEMETIVQEVEGKDERTYDEDDASMSKKKNI